MLEVQIPGISLERQEQADWTFWFRSISDTEGEKGDMVETQCKNV